MSSPPFKADTVGSLLRPKRLLDARDQHYLAENFLAFFERDWRRVAQLHVDSGWVPAGTRVEELEAAWDRGENYLLAIFQEGVGGHAVTPIAVRGLGDGRIGIVAKKCAAEN